MSRTLMDILDDIANGEQLSEDDKEFVAHHNRGLDENGIENPTHYCYGKYQAWDVVKDWDLDFDLGNVVKYISRAGRKNGESTLKDLKKAQQYLNHEIEYLENRE